MSVGTVVRARIVTDRETGRSRGFGFVEFSTDAEAAEAIRRFDGQELGGRTVRVNAAEDRRPGSGPRPPRPERGPSFYNGGGGPPSYEERTESPFGGGGPPFKTKGSRRGLRGRKRSLR